MDLLNTVYYFVLYFTPILVYLTLFKKSRRKLSVYSLPSRYVESWLKLLLELSIVLDWYHFIKLHFAKTAVKNIQRERRENLDDVTEISGETPQQLNSETVKKIPKSQLTKLDCSFSAFRQSNYLRNWSKR